MVRRTLDDSLLKLCFTRSGSSDARQEYLLERFAECQTEALGGQILKCSNCGTRVVHYNPCNVRGCPRCAGYHQGRWRESMQNRILPIGHFHLVFSAPGWLTELWLMRPTQVIDALFAAASQSIKAIFAPTGLLYGATLVFQSHGRRLCYKPHIHCLLTPGGVDREGRWQTHKGIDESSLTHQFAGPMIKRLERSLANYLTVVLGNACTHERFSVHATFHRDTPDALISYLARSTHGLILDPRTELEVAEATLRFTDTREDCELSYSEFLTRYFRHIPPARTVTIRHYGLYSTRHTGMLEWVRPQVHSKLRSVDPPSAEELFYPPCPHCHRRKLTLDYQFDPGQIPLELKVLAQIRGSPVPNNLIITASPRPQTPE